MKLDEFIGGLERISNFADKVEIFSLIDDLKKIKKSQKVKVPQFVADWYREHMDDLETALFRCVDIIPRVYEDGELNQFQEWFISGETKPFQTLVNMHQFGYEIEKEKKYTVKVKATKQYLCNDEIGPRFDPSFRTNFTKHDLKKLGFSWVFDCEGMEVKEV
jgi:hypothetical protein|nr:MAG TPA: Protein of unknown function (DUF1642) [Caudoviricetes sp.]